MALTPELQAKIAEWRQKAQAGTLTLEEQREAIKLLRAGRVSASYASEKSRAKRATKPVRSGEDLLGDLMGGIK